MMLVSIQATHNWLDGKMRVIGYKPIQNEYEFAKSGLLLSQVINNVVQHFQLYPPKNIVILDDSLNQLQNKRHHVNGSMTVQDHSSSTNTTSPKFIQNETNLPSHFSQEIRIQDEDLKEIKIRKDNTVRFIFMCGFFFWLEFVCESYII
jgi:hypothetical protein